MNQFSRNEWIAVGLAVCGIVFLFGDELLHKVDSWRNLVRDRVEEHVPLDYEIVRARRRTEELMALILKQREVVVRQTMDVESIQKELVDEEQKQQMKRDEIMSLRSKLESGGDTDSVIRSRLQNVFENYKLADTTLKARREVLQIRDKSLDDARRSLHAMNERRMQLQLQVENLVARLELIRAKGDQVPNSADATEIVECESQLQRLDSRLTFMEGMLDEGRLSDAGLAMTLDSNNQDLGSQVDQYFGVAE